MKKLLALLLAAIMCFSLVACGGGTPNTDDSSTQQNEAQQEAANNEDTDSSTETENNEPQSETVELTLENWNEYFEIVDKLDDKLMDMGKPSTGSSVGTGGMNTKLIAAKIATSAGADMVIANSKDIHIIHRIIDGRNLGTIFCANKDETFDLPAFVADYHK